MVPMASICQMTTVYSVLIVTVDRYIAICRPLQSMKLSTMRSARWAVGVTWFMAVIFNIPKLFEYEAEPYMYFCQESDGIERTCYFTAVTSFGSTKVYRIVYEAFFYFVVRFCTPLLILIICNLKLIKAIRTSRARHDDTHRHQRNTTVKLVAIVIVFIICITPDCMSRFSVLFSWVDMAKAQTVSYFANLLLVFNSTFNFIIYIYLGESDFDALCSICVPEPGLRMKSRVKSDIVNDASSIT